LLAPQRQVSQLDISCNPVSIIIYQIHQGMP
jgi:hypothetical protein